MRREKWFSFLSIPSRYDFIRTSSHNFHSSETRAGAYLIVSEQCSNSRTDWKNKETAEWPLKSQTHNLLCPFISMRMHPKKFQQVEWLSPLAGFLLVVCACAQGELTCWWANPFEPCGANKIDRPPLIYSPDRFCAFFPIIYKNITFDSAIRK